MPELDNKLQERLESLLKALVFDEIEYDEFVKDYMDSYIIAIGKAFHNAGYRHGNQFYERFTAETEWFAFEEGDEWRRQYYEAASKAAGIDVVKQDPNTDTNVSNPQEKEKN